MKTFLYPVEYLESQMHGQKPSLFAQVDSLSREKDKNEEAREARK